jgi:tRNA threonylcarbamoyladenosine biosynthesis protein TsaB
MYFLSFETSTKVFSLALNKDEKVLRYRNLMSASVLEDCILPAMDKMLHMAGVDLGAIDGFAVGLGPGSFTSLRVGLATVKALAMATSKPVVGIPSMDTIAYGVREADADEICVLNDARRGKVYACLYGSKGHSLEAKSGYLLEPLKDVLEKVSGRTFFVGEALASYRKEIEAAYQKHAARNNACKCLFAAEKWWYPQAREMSSLAYERFCNKRYDDAAKLLPLYLYPQDCQVSPGLNLKNA